MSDNLKIPFGNDEIETGSPDRVMAARAAGWTDIRYDYDDMAGGLVLIGLSPDGETKEIPR